MKNKKRVIKTNKGNTKTKLETKVIIKPKKTGKQKVRKKELKMLMILLNQINHLYQFRIMRFNQFK